MLVNSFYKNYSVSFETDLNLDNDFVVADKNIYQLYSNKFHKQPILIEAIESKKNIDTSIYVCQELLKKNIKKNTKVIVIGGGITQDICGFTMNILFRGVDWTYVPTTLLAQADSCIGSKTSLNLDSFKNVIGTFYPPSKIIINSEFLKTLETKDYFSGLGEVIKLHLIGGLSSFEQFNTGMDRLIDKDLMELQDSIKRCLYIKKEFIEQDELDLNKRQVLNFGHTFGHAIESETNYQIPHGIAVIFGMILANKVSSKIGLLSNDTTKDIYETLTKIIQSAGFSPYLLKDINKNNLIEKSKKDKKNTDNSTINMILMDNSFGFQKIPINVKELKQVI